VHITKFYLGSTLSLLRTTSNQVPQGQNINILLFAPWILQYETKFHDHILFYFYEIQSSPIENIKKNKNVWITSRNSWTHIHLKEKV